MAESFVRMTISVPGDVRKHMNRCPKSVNWSAIAAEAFSAEADRHTPRKKGKLMVTKASVARLRKSFDESQSSNYREGRESGFIWVTDCAEAEELKRLEKYHEEVQAERFLWERHFDNSSPSAFGHFGPLGGIAASIINRIPDEVTQDEIDGFFECALGENHESVLGDGDYMRGFFEGALEAWSQVEEQL